MTLSALNIPLEWDSNNRKEVENAKKIYQQAKKEFRKVTTRSGVAVTSFKPEYESLIIKEMELSKTQSSFRVFDDEHGDLIIPWDANNPEEIADAAKLFDKYIEKGWRAYLIHPNGKKGRRVYKFDPKAEEIFFDETNVGQKMKDFVKSFKQVQILPATRAG